MSDGEVPLASLPAEEQAKVGALASRVLAYFDRGCVESDEEAPAGAGDEAPGDDRAALYAGAVYTAVTDEQFAALLGRYDLGRFVSAEPLSGGLANSNFRVRTDAGRTVVVKVWDEKTAAELRTQLEALDVLRAAGFPTAYAIPSRDGSGLVEHDGMRVTVLEHVSGGVPRRGTPAVMRQLGDAVARMHAIETVPASLGAFPMGESQMRPFLDEEAPASGARDDPFVAYLARHLEALGPTLRRADLPPRIVHGDVFLENTMFEGDELRAIIDFEEVCAAPALLDVAMTVVGCCYGQDDALDYAAAGEFVRAYTARRPLSAAEREAFVDYARYALLSIAFWRFRQFNVRRPDEARKSAHLQMTRRLDALDEARWTAMLG